MSRRCDLHGMKLDLFCLGHNIAVCARCAQSDHFKCPQFVPVEDAAKYAKPSTLTGNTDESQREAMHSILNGEENTFTNYVKAEIASGENSTFNKYFNTSPPRIENNNQVNGNKVPIPLTTRRDFQEEKNMEESNIIVDDPVHQANDGLTTSRSFSTDHNEETQRNIESPKMQYKQTFEAPKQSTKTEVGQLLEDVQSFSKALSSRDDVGITLDDLIVKIDRSLFEIAENFADTRKQKTSIESQIKEIRKRLNSHLDNIQQRLLQSLESRFRQIEANVTNTIEKLQKGKTDIHNMKHGTVENQSSPLQANTILAIRESDKQVRRLKRSIHMLTENVYAIDLDVRINQDLEIFMNEIKSFGEVSVNSRFSQKLLDPIETKRFEIHRTDSKKSPASMQIKLPTKKQVSRSDSKKSRTEKKAKMSPSIKRELIETTQKSNVQALPEIELGQSLARLDETLPDIVVTSRSGISGIRILQKKKVKIGHKWTSNVSNCKILPNGRLMFIDSENKRLVIHNKDTYVYRNLRVNDEPRDFAIIDGERVAVTFGVYIEILNIATSKIEKRIPLEFFYCRGISYMNRKFYIYGIFDGYLLSRHGIQIMDMNGRVEDRLPITRMQTVHHSIATWKSRIYYTGYSTINCCMTSGEEIWVFRHDSLDHPKSLTLDAHGNVFAVYDNANKIVIISVDGMYSKEFELRKHDLYYGQEPKPISLYFDIIESALVVCNENKDHSVMYFVKYDN